MQYRPAPPFPTLVVAARSARLMAESAAADGYQVIALDTYGDADTRRAAARWIPIGEAGGPIDPVRLLDALVSLQDEPLLLGWVAGSDLDGAPELLARAAERLPLLGTSPESVARLRDPARFFGTLDALSLPHPEVSLTPPDPAEGWLFKDALGCGGWHIRRADRAGRTGGAAADAARRPFYQREQAGAPMSALFVANGQRARLVGVNALIVRPLGALPHVYRGAVGPVMVPLERLAELNAALDRLAGRFTLRGLASLDFLLSDSGLSLLEINPRPSASMALYSRLWPLMQAHVEACLHDHLPLLADHHPGTLQGCELLLARQDFTLDAAQAALLAARLDCHDLPAAGSRFRAGDPVCTLSATGPDVATVTARLDALRRSLRDRLAPAPAATRPPGQPGPPPGAVAGSSPLENLS